MKLHCSENQLYKMILSVREHVHFMGEWNAMVGRKLAIQFLFWEMTVLSMSTSPRADLDKHVEHPVPVNRWLGPFVWCRWKEEQDKRLEEQRGRQYQGQVWSSCYQVGGLLSEERLSPDFTEVKNLEKIVFET